MSLVKIKEETVKKKFIELPTGEKIYQEVATDEDLERIRNQWETFFENWDELRKKHGREVAVISDDYKIHTLSKKEFKRTYWKVDSDYDEKYGRNTIPIDIDNGKYCGLVGHRRH